MYIYIYIYMIYICVYICVHVYLYINCNNNPRIIRSYQQINISFSSIVFFSERTYRGVLAYFITAYTIVFFLILGN